MDPYGFGLGWNSEKATCLDDMIFGLPLAHRFTYPNPADAKRRPICENHVRELRTFFTVVLEPNIHTFSVLSETLPDFLKSKLC